MIWYGIMLSVTILQGLLLAVILGVLAVVGGILSNWIPRPAKMRTRWILACLAGVVLATAVIGLLSNGRPRPLQDWVAEVNQSCNTAQDRIESLSQSYEAAKDSRSIKERVPAMKSLAAAHSELYKEVSHINMPSDPNGSGKAEDWLNAYGVRRDRLTNFVDLLDSLPDSISSADTFVAQRIGEAAQSFTEATTAAKRKNEMLGISCP
jgi:hypothetical protein